ncbi:hypothetical protein JTB14_024257 [Gonioctena quinquepunctata]|nr:hypothetical protein JTB14_024257 [Gonioctena quinquepunctata]
MPDTQLQVVNITTPVSVSPPEKFLSPYPGTWTTWRKRFERNIIYKRFEFHSTIQKPGEPIESFIKNLHSVNSEHCNYGTLKEEFIRDRIVVGMLDTKTYERLILKQQLDLKECILIVKRAELRASQNKELYNTSRLVNRVQYSSQSPRSEGFLRPRSEGSQRPRSEGSQRGRMNVGTSDKCGFCGLRSHPRDQCPAGKSKCRKCEKSGHWATVCRSSKVRSIQTSDLNQELDLDKLELEFNSLDTSHSDQSQCANNFLGSITLNHVDTKEWLASIFVSEINKNIEFLIDSGADITCVSKEIFDVSFLNQLQVSDKIVTGPSGVKLKVLGTLPDVGTFKTEMHIKLVDGAQLFVQSVPRVVCIPLLKPLEEELERLQKLDIIELIDTPTEWVIQTKPIDELTPCLQRFRIRLMRYDYEIYHSPGKDLVVADALSRNFSVDQEKPKENELASEVEAHEGIAKDKSAKQFDKRHRTRKLSDLAIGYYVWVTGVYGKVIKVLDEPRSYLIESINSGVYRRNRWHLVPAPYYSESTVTPRWAVPIDNNFKNEGQTSESMLPVNREPQVNIGTENLEDRVRQDAHSVFSPRPERLIQKSTYLDDYIPK